MISKENVMRSKENVMRSKENVRITDKAEYIQCKVNLDF